MLDTLVFGFCALGVTLLLYARFRPLTWYPTLRAVLLRVFALIAIAIVYWKISTGAWYSALLSDALARTPGAQLKDYSASIQALSQAFHLHNLTFFAAAIATGVAADLRSKVPQTTAAASA